MKPAPAFDDDEVITMGADEENAEYAWVHFHGYGEGVLEHYLLNEHFHLLLRDFPSVRAYLPLGGNPLRTTRASSSAPTRAGATTFLTRRVLPRTKCAWRRCARTPKRPTVFSPSCPRLTVRSSWCRVTAWASASRCTSWRRSPLRFRSAHSWASMV